MIAGRKAKTLSVRAIDNSGVHHVRGVVRGGELAGEVRLGQCRTAPACCVLG